MARPLPIPRFVPIGVGIVLIVVAPFVGVLPGPGGIFVFAGGLILVLRHSARARRRWVALKRGWPRLGMLTDLAMRRGSAVRRRARARTAVQAAAGRLD